MIFLFFGSPLAHLETELELFEVWEIMVRQIIITIITKLQTALARFLDELERNQKKENHLNTIYKMMGTLVHVQKLPIGDKIKNGQNLGTLKWPHRH